jgi:ribonuclease HI
MASSLVRPLRWESPAPWHAVGSRRWQVRPSLDGGSRKGAALETLQKDTLETVTRGGLGCRWTVYTDGSAAGGTSDGGSAAVITRGDPSEPEVLQVRRRKGARRTCSYEMEVSALHLAMEWCETAEDGDVLICTDSQAVLRALESPAANDEEAVGTLRRRLSKARRRISLQWVPGHCGLPGNDRADLEACVAACRGATVDGEGMVVVSSATTSMTIAYTAAKAHLKEACLRERIQHPRVVEVYGSEGWRPRMPSGGRSEHVLVAQLKAGHCAKLAAYARIVNPSADPTCPRCEEEPRRSSLAAALPSAGSEEKKHFRLRQPTPVGA